MTKILAIRSSASGDKSVTNQLVDAYLTAVTAAEPAATIVQRDLDAEPIPHLTSATMAGVGRPAPETSATAATRELSDTLVAELQAADTLVIGLPMYNFGMPSTLKSWFDHVLRAGVTFQYTASGPEGLVKGKRAVIICWASSASPMSKSFWPKAWLMARKPPAKPSPPPIPRWANWSACLLNRSTTGVFP